MQNGKIAQAGKFEELLKQNIGFEVLVGAHSKALESILTVENSSRPALTPIVEGESNSNSNSDVKLVHTQHDTVQVNPPESKGNEGKLVQDEERETGSIAKEVYWSYLTTVKGGALVPVILLAQSSFQILQIASNYWMAWVCPTSSDAKPIFEMNFILLIYMALSVAGAFCVLVRAMLVANAGLWTAQKLFTDMMHSVLRAPMSFFDSTPTGRILNRVNIHVNAIYVLIFSTIVFLNSIGMHSKLTIKGLQWNLLMISL